MTGVMGPKGRDRGGGWTPPGVASPPSRPPPTHRLSPYFETGLLVGQRHGVEDPRHVRSSPTTLRVSDSSRQWDQRARKRHGITSSSRLRATRSGLAEKPCTTLKTLSQWTRPSGAEALNFTTSGGTGDADLYVRYNLVPDGTAYACRSMSGSNADQCSIPSPQAGTYYVRLYG